MAGTTIAHATLLLLVLTVCIVGVSANFASAADDPVQAVEMPSVATPESGESGPETLGWENVVWQNLNPGAGGNIQDLAVDPNTPGRLFISSDMEGHYRSDNYGQTWKHVGGDLADSYVNSVCVEPGDRRRVYVGTLQSLEISDDEGLTYHRAPEVRGSVAQIIVDPSDPSLVMGLPGERHRWGAPSWDPTRFDSSSVDGPWGERNVYLSRDRGRTFTTVRYAAAPGRRDVFSGEFAADGSIILGTATGIYRSNDKGATWSEVEPPAGTGDGMGACVSADGSVLYGSYRVAGPNGEPPPVTTSHTSSVGADGRAVIFARRLDRPDAGWTDISRGSEGFAFSGHFGDVGTFWRPKIDPRSTPTHHRLAVGTVRPQHGLWLAEIDWSSEKPVATWSQIMSDGLDQAAGPRAGEHDFGWEQWGIMAEDVEYAPLSWGEPMMFMNGGQVSHVSRLDDRGRPIHWEPRYTRWVGNIAGVDTYRTRGFESVFVFDADSDGNYVAQAVGDNCLLESYDYGYSWSMRGKPGSRISARSNSVAIVRIAGQAPIVLAHIAEGWGADAQTGTLYAKRLITRTPTDLWIAIAGGSDRIAGLPYLEYNGITVDPHSPKRVYVPTNGRGVHVIDDIEKLLAAAEQGTPPPKVRWIGTPGQPAPAYAWYTSGRFAVDPSTPDVLFASDQIKNGRVWRGDRQPDGGWTWKIVRNETLDGRFACWKTADGRTALAAPMQAGHAWDIAVSYDRGETWSRLVGFEQVKPLRSLRWFDDALILQPAGLLGDGDRLWFCYTTSFEGGMRPYGIFTVDLHSGKVTDETADMPWAFPVTSRIVTQADGRRELYFSSRGMGLWRKQLGNDDH